MSLSSPRPEKAQLNTPIKPKSTSQLFELISHSVPNSLKNEDKRFPLANKQSYSDDQSLYLRQSSSVTPRNGSISTDLSPISNTSSPSRIVQPFSLNSRFNESKVIDSTPSTAFYNQSRSEPSLNSIQDDQLIPSPPLSPKIGVISEVKIPKLSTCIGKNKLNNDLYVKVSWDSKLSPKTYRHANQNFLSHYSFLNHNSMGSTISHLPNNNNTMYLLKHSRHRNNKYSSRTGTDYEHQYRTRKTATKNGTSLSDSDDYLENSSNSFHRFTSKQSHKTSPLRRTKKASPSTASPLASVGSLNGMTQYVPKTSWEKLPDYSPSTINIPLDNTKCLKVEWKGSPMNLSNDPLRDKLHPAEIALAQILRLPCDLYLDSKRRLFLEKVCRLKKGLPFRRTDAQKACRIDVNKASRLFAAFEKVGWLNDSHFTQFL
ncbi:hypothetical protein TBLA_0A04560 [Henningerozyma blattae CBS 6284]|uniref:SWIRM domain-containing protein n=1 Tax=Henningerozyma blattae (strain ATCC 34711 / CBS 6284 / DSM 70876 / NBRC 10599 / NRRL Y-10934 / UCD 77-7) TaxID=1071380 RepID=I2GVU8_HENB6|nr:hypothetical protein TBLA_0A04560 [Tetrapisispora blattae CBS 6284]CCH58250.1 hypothetical protein TBLA_0A04560 [Tetrapisispora blattae CBS 6284]